MGLPPRPGARRQGLRPGEARPDERDPRPLVVGADRSSAARPRTRATPRSSPTTAPTSRRTEYLEPLLRRRDLLDLLDDRTPGRLRPRPVHLPGRTATATSGCINGEKWFASNYPFAEFLIVMVITNPDVPVYKGSSMILVPKRHRRAGDRARRRPGRRAHRRRATTATCASPTAGCRPRTCSATRARASRSPRPGSGGGRVHHGMRSVGVAQRALDMMCERALSRRDEGLADRREAGHPALGRRLVDPDPAVPAPGAAHAPG